MNSPIKIFQTLNKMLDSSKSYKQPRKTDIFFGNINWQKDKPTDKVFELDKGVYVLHTGFLYKYNFALHLNIYFIHSYENVLFGWIEI